MIRQQGAKTAGATSVAAASTPSAAVAAPAGKKLSPLEMIRQQAALKSSGAPAPATESAPVPVAEAAAVAVDAPTPVETPKPTAPKVADGKKLSPIEQIRAQAAARANK